MSFDVGMETSASTKAKNVTTGMTVEITLTKRAAILHLATRANFVVQMPFAFPSVGDVTDTPTARISLTNEIAHLSHA